MLLRIWDVARTKSIYISIASLPELKELGKYEYFFRVYHNNEIYRTQTEIDLELGLGWVKMKRPSTLGNSLAKARSRAGPIDLALQANTVNYFLCF